MNVSVERCIISTLSYAHVFRAGIAQDKLYAWLLGSQPVSRTDFAIALKRLEKKRILVCQKGYVVFDGDTKLVNEMERRQEFSKTKIASLQPFLRFLRVFPLVIGVAVTGSVAVGNCKSDEDIDFLVVTQSNCLWISRIVCCGYAAVLGKLRRLHSLNLKDLWCFNLWLTDSTLKLPSHDVYTAREVVQAHWIFERVDIKERFMSANPWVREFVANAEFSSTPISRKSPTWIRLTSILNEFAYIFQRLHMNITKENVTREAAYFHPRDTHAYVMKRFYQIDSQHQKRYP